MADTSVNFCGLDLKNPVLVASGPVPWNAKLIKKCADAGAAAVVTKDVVLNVVKDPRPTYGVARLGRQAMGIQNMETYSQFEMDRWLMKEIPEAKKIGIPIIGSVAGDSPEDYVKVAKKLEEAKVDMLHLDISCPHALSGAIVGTDPKLSYEYVKAVKESVSLPIMTKLTPNVTDITVVARAVEAAGTDAICTIDTVRGLIGVDVDKAEPLFPTYGGYSGPAVKPIALRCVGEVVSNVKIPVSGIGGIANWKDAVEHMMMGATTVQLCTAIMLRGIRAITDVTKGIAKFMDEKGYSTLEEFRGKGLRRLLDWNKIEITKPKARLINNKCIGCGICEDVCFPLAIEVTGNNVDISDPKCIGCGLCIQMCPVDALGLVPASRKFVMYGPQIPTF